MQDESERSAGLRVGDVHVFKEGDLLFKNSLFGQKRPCRAQLKGTTLTVRLEEQRKIKLFDIARAKLAKQSVNHRIVLILASKEKISLYAAGDESFDEWLQVLADSIQWRIQRFYDIGREIGHGAFATVRKGRRKRTKEDVAIKVISKDAVSQQDLKYLQREVDIAQSVCHDNIVRTEDVFDSLGKLYIVLEYMPGGTLQTFIDKNGAQNETATRAIMRDLLTALEYVHQKRIVHRDIKPENILCTKASMPMAVKIMDFGLSRHIHADDRHSESSPHRSQQRDSGLGPDGLMTTPVGTPAFVAPEILMSLPYGKEVDMFASGVVLYWLLSATLPFDHPNPEELIRLIKKTEFDFADELWMEVSQPAKDLISRMLERSPYARISATEALSHEWMLVCDGRSVSRKTVGFARDVEVVSIGAASVSGNQAAERIAVKGEESTLEELSSPVSICSARI